MTWSSSWMLPLLLPLLIAFHEASLAPTPAPCSVSMHEFNAEVDELSHHVKACQVNCTTTHLTNTTFPGYFIKALEYFLPSVSKEEPISNLIIDLTLLKAAECKHHIPAKYLENVTVNSLQQLHEKLKNLTQELNSIFARQSAVDRHQ